MEEEDKEAVKGGGAGNKKMRVLRWKKSMN